MKYTGSCHCQKVRFEFESEEIQGWMMCNCSICQRRGHILHMIPASFFHLISWEGNLTEYRFNTKNIAHLFCKTCWVQAFWKGPMPDWTEMIAINLNCVDGIDYEKLSIHKYDGKSL